MAEFTFEIEEHLLTLSENEKGWTKETKRWRTENYRGAAKMAESAQGKGESGSVG